MAVLMISIVCIAMIVVGGMTLSQGYLTSADTAALNVNQLSVMEGDIARTDLTITRAVQLSWADYVRLTVKNDGQTKLCSFDKWDVLVNYIDSDGSVASKWLPYTLLPPGDNQWQKARIGLNGPVEFFEPGILNPSEEMVVLIHLDLPPQVTSTGDVSMVAPNGVESALPFTNLGYARFTAQSETVTLGNGKYYELVEGAESDGTAIISGAAFSTNESARKLLYNIDDPTRAAKHVYPLVGITQIPAGLWVVYYHGFVGGHGGFPQADGDTCFNIDIIVRQADGSIRTVIAERVAAGWVAQGEGGAWMTFSGTYNFSGYTVVDENDYLEIDFYGLSLQGPNAPSGNMQISIDDDTLDISEQTRIEAYTS
jgi:archaellum component FlaF (FlaF/FlaG flagellin family)